MTTGKSGTKKRKGKKRKPAPHKTPRGYTKQDMISDNGWFEMIEYFDVKRARRFTMKEDKGQRVFMLGALNENVIVQVPRGTSDEAILKLQETLSDSGIKGVIMGDDVKWCRFRRCSPDEEKVLDDAGIPNEEQQTISVPWAPESEAIAAEPEH